MKINIRTEHWQKSLYETQQQEMIYRRLLLLVMTSFTIKTMDIIMATLTIGLGALHIITELSWHKHKEELNNEWMKKQK